MEIMKAAAAAKPQSTKTRLPFCLNGQLRPARKSMTGAKPKQPGGTAQVYLRLVLVCRRLLKCWPAFLGIVEETDDGDELSSDSDDKWPFVEDLIPDAPPAHVNDQPLGMAPRRCSKRRLSLELSVSDGHTGQAASKRPAPVDEDLAPAEQDSVQGRLPKRRKLDECDSSPKRGIPAQVPSAPAQQTRSQTSGFVSWLPEHARLPFNCRAKRTRSRSPALAHRPLSDVLCDALGEIFWPR
jgi:hypothetical protein